MQMIKKFFLTFFKYLSPVVLLLLPLMALYGFLYPWPEAKAALSKYHGEMVFLSGMKSEYSGSYEKRSNTYLIIKADPISSETVTVTTDSNGMYEVTQEDGGLLSILFLYAAMIFSLWWFWIKKRNITERSSEAQ
ncbi:hypothetical protein H8K33_13560 [Undibacterium amnicola]|uniref:Carboxypeptidase regulatory-like domain-containing protein n=1 Tax=Undibacterium amnicola TaxID=1834038 RepID=A0ABR6XSS7_9BURK|nr:hypothetical protein [Undibacterium amnicola]MBC3832529.1 hypothetical protein [Undibacterium amnicola]